MEKHKNRLPRVAAIHDLSCFGRCALTVVIPALSAAGIQAVPIPTALLSTHTGGFEGLSFLDLSDEMTKIIDHFERLGLDFDAIYTGFLGNVRQIEIVSDFIDRFGGGCVFVDPVMGDDGELYQTCTDKLVDGMRRLIGKADIITPNLTEACFLTGIPYESTDMLTEAGASALAERLVAGLSKLTDARICITGIHCENNMIATCTAENGDVRLHCVPHIGRNYPGTGDLFASVMLAKLLQGEPFDAAAGFASDFTRDTIAVSEQASTPVREGVSLEAMIKSRKL